MSKYPVAFAERNKVAIAIIGLTVMVLAFLTTLNAAALPVIGGGQTHQAYFAEAGGIRPGNEVRVAGIKVGEVTDLELEGDKVLLTFRVKGADLGDETRASVRLKTTLGQKYLALDPLGEGELDKPIPVDRTTTPYDVQAAFSDLSDTIADIDTDQLAQSLDVLSTAFQNTPEELRGTLEGLTDLSRVVADRDDEIARLLGATKEVSGTLAERNSEFAKLIQDGDALLKELASRRETVQALLRGSAELGTQVRGLVKDNEKTLRPALDKLDKVSEILQNNQDELESALKKLGPYYRALASATGNGPYVDAYLCGLFGDDGAPLLQNDVERNCTPQKGGGE